MEGALRKEWSKLFHSLLLKEKKQQKIYILNLNKGLSVVALKEEETWKFIESSHEDRVEYDICIFCKIYTTFATYVYFVRILVLILDNSSQY